MQDNGPRPGQQIIEVVLPTYVMAPKQDEKFYPSSTKAICEAVLAETLTTAKYDEDDSKQWVVDIGNKIKAQIRELNVPRYKVIVQVTVGQMLDQGVHIASRCLWDTANDNYASVNFTNNSLWANVIVFGIYTD